MAHTFATDRGNEQLVWDVHRLWELSRDLPVETVPLEEVVAVLDEGCWFGSDDRPTCRSVADHARRIHETELAYPIILSAQGNVMDGVHRIAKAWMLGQKELQVVRFTEDPEPDRRVPKQRSHPGADSVEAAGLGQAEPAVLPMRELMKQATAAEDLIVGHFGAIYTEGERRTWSSVRTDGAVEKLLANPEDRVARVLAVLVDPTRLRLLRSLLRTPQSAAELAAELPPEAAGQTDHHLRGLERAGFVRQRGGRYHFLKDRQHVYLTALALAADAGAEAGENADA
jgi:DNA-binding transcriptional ArsR family regulator